MEKLRATLALADGRIFEGYSVGAEGETSGEVVFNTSMSGYQEIVTDPSYRGQLLTFTYPHIGNVGVNPDDVESDAIQVAGIIVRELSTHYSNYRATKSFAEYLIDSSIVAIGGIDTRALVLHLRDTGAQNGVIATGTCDIAELVLKAKSIPSMEGLNLAERVSTREAYEWQQGSWALDAAGGHFREFTTAELASRPLVVAIDFGIKRNILRLLVDQGFRVRVVPANTSAADILALNPAGVFLSNGPGDPAAITTGIRTTKELLGKLPIFGICLGHQILGLATGAQTYKLKFGHRGGNHPVKDLQTGTVDITVQNHGFATDPKSIPAGVRVTHTNLNDSTIEGLEIPEARAFSVQFHPEASPGPRDAQYLFEKFKDYIALPHNG